MRGEGGELGLLAGKGVREVVGLVLQDRARAVVLVAHDGVALVGEVLDLDGQRCDLLVEIVGLVVERGDLFGVVVSLFGDAIVHVCDCDRGREGLCGLGV